MKHEASSAGHLYDDSIHATIGASSEERATSLAKQPRVCLAQASAGHKAVYRWGTCVLLLSVACYTQLEKTDSENHSKIARTSSTAPQYLLSHGIGCKVVPHHINPSLTVSVPSRAAACLCSDWVGKGIELLHVWSHMFENDNLDPLNHPDVQAAYARVASKQHQSSSSEPASTEPSFDLPPTALEIIGDCSQNKMPLVVNVCNDYDQLCKCHQHCVGVCCLMFTHVAYTLSQCMSEASQKKNPTAVRVVR